ncbi:peptidoglycan-binding domain-containing protein [Streptomyces nogalater]|uniref:Peptidoglycan-binding domain-containing protein n=1 Tax=Streptomyces nogalater TaxID=38314 RepID=A0ABW0WM33_STRNO
MMKAVALLGALVIGTLATTGAPASALTTAAGTPSATSCATARPFLSAGDRGTCVAFLQRRLNAKGAKDLTVDGVFGPATTRAVKTFQKACGFRSHEVDGLVGPKTWNGLIEGSCV